MTRKTWLGLGPSLLVGAGIVVSTLIAVLTAESGWLVLAGPLFLALAAVGADMLDSRLRGTSSGPFRSALSFGGVILLAAVIVALRDPNLVKTLIPIIGASAWITLVLCHESRRTTCRGT